MSYTEQAQGINKELKEFFNSDVQTLTNRQKEFILNLFCRFGQVCKFRCRSNSAYDSFVKECFKDICEVKRVKANPTDEWETLRTFIEKEETEKEETDSDMIKAHFEGSINIINLPKFRLINSAGCSMQGDLSKKDINDLLKVGWKPELNSEEFINII